MKDIEIIHGDCLSILPTLGAGSVDAIVTDPPYGQSNEDYDKGAPDEVWRECFRVAADNAALLSFAGGPTYHGIASSIERAGWHVRQMWGWVYRNGFITSAWPKEGFDRLAPAMDPICFATKGRVLLNLEREGKSEWTRSANSRGASTFSERTSSHGLSRAEGRWPRTIVADAGLGEFRYFALNGNDASLQDEKTGHPNQKPLPLMRWLVEKLPKDFLILDPYAGSGTTGVAALKTGRRCVLIEKDARYIPIIERRIAAARTPLFDGVN